MSEYWERLTVDTGLMDPTLAPRDTLGLPLLLNGFLPEVKSKRIFKSNDNKWEKDSVANYKRKEKNVILT